MNEERLRTILHRVDNGILSQLARSVLAASPEIRVIKPPQVGLVMMQARETVENEPFNLGEVLVTECTVALGEATGWGCCLGDDPERAYHLAVLDLALHLGVGPVDGIRAALLAEEERILREDGAEFANIARSRVQFEALG
ncbi:phosphonate C-P lyase system protein PhnG [Desulfofundulus sp. TPOSR]|uniref:Phosphonate C-P lyase system protein PhnG n=1 Tax=Desulfofundulus kuznetsovii (strain DSM 6115 / VKM B-1805 / 17) TaxID=760568 RepID=A0AAU8PJ45_DESK7|nr:phosphonate C-P lyase system protein PhnG [Desulfofundulus sp. TPOSR]AEG15799.1 phosphonate C-P lyase system protein PhnG [Desulfofundulus kuznetsovii DSM 6115]NHM27582.1 phosphonate C-P lyase system protein PhnG [Desulfofundulus sp. TPOSR]